MKKLYPLLIVSPSSTSDRPIRSHEWGWRGRSLFLTSKGRSPLTTFSRVTGDRSFYIQRSIALLVWCRSIALYSFFSTKGDRHEWYEKVDRSLGNGKGNHYQLITVKLVTFANSRSAVTKLAEFWIVIAAITASGSFKRCCWRISIIF